MITNTIGIDIGTYKTVISDRGGEILLCEPTVAVVNPYTAELIAAGKEALDLCGSISSDVRMITPVKNGIICDFEVMHLLLKSYLQRVLKGKLSFLSPKAVICIPYGMNDMQISETLDTLKCAGLRDVKIIERPLASALGAGINIDSPSGRMIIEIGAGLTEVATICMGKIVSCETLSLAGDTMDDTISAKINKRCGIKIGKKMAEAVKLNLSESENVTICGRNTSSGLPATAVIPSKEITKALEDDIRSITLLAKHVLSSLPSSLCSDILSSGIILTGGGAKLFSLAEQLSSSLETEVIIAEQPELCAAIGVGMHIGEKQLELFGENTA